MFEPSKISNIWVQPTFGSLPLPSSADPRRWAQKSNQLMPRKIRELLQDLRRAGFVDRGGKGSHRNFEHPSGVRVTISGNLGADAKPYQEKELKRKIEEAGQ